MVTSKPEPFQPSIIKLSSYQDMQDINTSGLVRVSNLSDIVYDPTDSPLPPQKKKKCRKQCLLDIVMKNISLLLLILHYIRSVLKTRSQCK